MGVLDIYGFEIFEVRQIAAQTSLFFILTGHKGTVRPSKHFYYKENNFALGCLRACFGTCVEPVGRNVELMKPH